MQPSKESENKSCENESTFGLEQVSSNRFFQDISVQPISSLVQPKLKVNIVGDKYEREADHIAQQVMRMAEPLAQTSRIPEDNIKQPNFLDSQNTPLFQRKSSKCEEELKEKIQTKSENGNQIEVSSELANKIKNSSGNGQPIDTNARSFMENRFGINFGNVRVHNNSSAIHMNRELQAKAFTKGSDIFFNKGQYNPGSHEGKTLLAHELTHVVQQGGAGDVVQRDFDPEIGVSSFLQTDTGRTTQRAEKEKLDTDRRLERKSDMLWEEKLQGKTADSLSDNSFQRALSAKKIDSLKEDIDTYKDKVKDNFKEGKVTVLKWNERAQKSQPVEIPMTQYLKEYVYPKIKEYNDEIDKFNAFNNKVITILNSRKGRKESITADKIKTESPFFNVFPPKTQFDKSEVDLWLLGKQKESKSEKMDSVGRGIINLMQYYINRKALGEEIKTIQGFTPENADGIKKMLRNLVLEKAGTFSVYDKNIVFSFLRIFAPTDKEQNIIFGYSTGQVTPDDFLKIFSKENPSELAKENNADKKVKPETSDAELQIVRAGLEKKIQTIAKKYFKGKTIPSGDTLHSKDAFHGAMLQEYGDSHANEFEADWTSFIKETKGIWNKIDAINKEVFQSSEHYHANKVYAEKLVPQLDKVKTNVDSNLADHEKKIETPPEDALPDFWWRYKRLRGMGITLKLNINKDDGISFDTVKLNDPLKENDLIFEALKLHFLSPFSDYLAYKWKAGDTATKIGMVGIGAGVAIPILIPLIMDMTDSSKAGNLNYLSMLGLGGEIHDFEFYKLNWQAQGNKSLGAGMKLELSNPKNLAHNGILGENQPLYKFDDKYNLGIGASPHFNYKNMGYNPVTGLQDRTNLSFDLTTSYQLMLSLGRLDPNRVSFVDYASYIAKEGPGGLFKLGGDEPKEKLNETAGGQETSVFHNVGLNTAFGFGNHSFKLDSSLIFGDQFKYGTGQLSYNYLKPVSPYEQWGIGGNVRLSGSQFGEHSGSAQGTGLQFFWQHDDKLMKYWKVGAEVSYSHSYMDMVNTGQLDNDLHEGALKFLGNYRGFQLDVSLSKVWGMDDSGVQTTIGLTLPISYEQYVNLFHDIF